MSKVAGDVWRFLGRPPRRTVLVLAVAGALIFAASRMLRTGKIEPGLLSPQKAGAPNEPVGAVAYSLVPVSAKVVGTIQSRTPVDAASRIAASVQEVTVRAGDRVKRGQVLVTLDSADLKAEVARARGELDAARAELARASADEKRFSALLRRGSVTERESEQAEAAWRSATATVAQSEAAVAAAGAALKYAAVASPTDGVVAERLVEPGDLALAGKPLVRLYDEKALRVELRVPEDLVRHVTVGMPLTVTVGATGEQIAAAVNEMVPEADPRSRSFLVRAAIAAHHGLRPGMFVRASFSTGTEKVLTAPRDAIAAVGQLDTVRVATHEGVEVREVSIGRTIGDRVEILAGLREGEKILLNRHGPSGR